MNILITGAGGFIGNHLFECLCNQHKIYRIFSPSNSNLDNNSYAVDLSDKKMVDKMIDILSKHNIHSIIHLASKMSSPSLINDLDVLKENIAITENIVLLTKKIKPQVLINFSSMAVYPNVSGLFSEEAMPAPQNNTDCIYGLSKYCSEVIIDYFFNNENIQIIHLRVAQVYGNGMQSDRIIPIMRKELGNSNSITVYGNGKRESNFIEVSKLVKYIEYFLHHDISGVYNLGDQNLSYYELAKLLIGQYGNEGSTIVKTQKGSKEKFNLDSSKIQDLVIY